jgi:hypothetical protein
MMMRRKDLSGEKEWMATMLERCVRIVAREAGWNIARSSRLVIRRVFDGGAGVERGGMEERSIESGVRGDRGDRVGDDEVGEWKDWGFDGETAMASMYRPGRVVRRVEGRCNTGSVRGVRCVWRITR